MTGDHNATSPNDEDTELEEEEELTQEESTTSNVFDTTNIITAYKRYHSDLRIIIPPHLEISGLLLTLSFGAIYFIIKDSKDIPIQIPKLTMVLLILIISFLIVSIFLGIASIYLRPIPRSLERNGLEELTYHSNIYKTERKCYQSATIALIFALLLLLGALLSLALQENSMDMALNKTKENNSSQNTIIYILSNNSFVNLNGTNTYTINNSRQKFQIGLLP
jgi:cytochrome bd-type quinol oxidase subunit 2